MKIVRLFWLIVLMLPIILQISLRAKAAPDPLSMMELPSSHQMLAPEESISTSDAQLLALYALAFDNSPVSDLSWAYAGTITGLQEATVNQPNKIVLALVDMPGQDNTFILRIENGEITEIEGLPDITGGLSMTIAEYNMTDGAMLGGFLLWARTTHAADKTTFSYIGHGGPLIPEADSTESLELPPYGLPSAALPSRSDLKGSLADITPEQSLLSLYSLSEALRIGTNSGSNPLDVLDLVHCFASTIEEYYALHSYTKTMTGSPNYSYYADEMPGQALKAIEPSAEADEIAEMILQQYEEVLLRYDSWLDSEDYPRLMVAVDSSQIPVIKQLWDQIAGQIMANFDRTKLENAYRNSGGYYDTTHCDQDWRLEAPDAVVDIGKFAFQLGEKFEEPISSSVENLQQVISDTIIVRHSQNGEPWFATTSPKPYWNFDGNAGIGIYADFVGTPLDEDNDGQEDIHLTWQGSFYTDTAVITNTNGVEVPQYAFLQPAEPNGVTWAHVFDRFWQGTNNLQFDSCLLDSQTPNMTDLEVTISSSPETVEVGSPLTYTINVTNHSPMTATQTTLFNISPSSVNLIQEPSASKGICSELSEGIICHLGTITHTEIATVTITVNPTEARWITNVVNVTNEMPDINVVNDTVTEEVEVLPATIPNTTPTHTPTETNTPPQIPTASPTASPTATPTASSTATPAPWQADLSVEQSDMFDPVALGQSQTYTITVRNNGPATATNVSLFDDLPDGVEFVSATSSQGTCPEPSNNEFTCEFASLAPLENATVVLVVEAQERGVITNTVNVSNAVPDPNLGNNSSVEKTVAALDVVAPVVLDFEIADDAPSTEQVTVTLATDGIDMLPEPRSGISACQFVEYSYSSTTGWIPVQRSNWIDYQTACEDYPWTLIDTAGIRYIRAWVKDDTGNISRDSRRDHINLLPSEQVAFVGEGEVVLYRMLLNAGQTFIATLTPMSGDPDLYIWEPNGDMSLSNNAAGIELITFEASETGTYQIEVHGYTDAEYRLSFEITQQASTEPLRAFQDNSKELPTAPLIPINDIPEDIYLEDIYFPPSSPYTIYLPTVIR